MCACAHVRMCVCAYVRMCVCAYLCICASVCLYVCVCVCVCVYTSYVYWISGLGALRLRGSKLCSADLLTCSALSPQHPLSLHGGMDITNEIGAPDPN